MTRIIETSDAASNATTPYHMVAGDEFFGQLTHGTSDWVAVTLSAGTTYSIGATGLGAVSSGASDPFLKLHDAGGSVLAHNDNGGPGLASSVTFTASTSGTYYIEVDALAASGSGDYGLVLTEGDLPSYGVEMGAAILYRPGNSWSDTPETATTVTWGVRATGPARDASGNPAPFHNLTQAQIDATKLALANYSDVANIVFQQVNPGGTTDHATILVGGYTSTSDGAGAFANYPGGRGDNAAAGDLWINTNSVSSGQIKLGTYDQFIFLHELGHAMGLAHPGDYNAAPGVSITYNNAAQFVQDSEQYSVMSYFQAHATEKHAPHSYADTLMMYDIFAVQQLYGVNHDTRAGNDTYGFHSTVGGAYDFTTNTDPLLCIWDGAGKDTLDLSGFKGHQVIDLHAGMFSDVGGFKGNLSIALGCDIENAIGGMGSDTMYGNGLNNGLKGGKGADVLAGDAGNDKLSGNGGADGFVFVAGSDKDKITDFDTGADTLDFSTSLWGGGGMTAAQVIDDFAHIRHGHVVFDFGTDQVILLGVTATAGLESQILFV